MNRLIALPAGLLTAAAMMLAAAPAMARVDVAVNLGIPAPVYVTPPPPVYYVQPRPVYVAPQPVYVAEPYRYRHYHRWHDRDRDGVPDRYDRHPYNPYRP